MAETRNIVAPETADWIRQEGRAGYTFHAPLDCDPGSPALTVAAVRVGDHAHIHVESGVARERQPGGETARVMLATRGFAGKLTLRWPEWEIFRDLLAVDGRCHVVEVAYPTQAQAEHYAGSRP